MMNLPFVRARLLEEILRRKMSATEQNEDKLSAYWQCFSSLRKFASASGALSPSRASEAKSEITKLQIAIIFTWESEIH